MLTRTVPAFSLACLAMMLVPTSAHAGSWKFSCTGSGSESFSEPGYQENNAWTPPNPSFGTYYQVSGLSCPSASYTNTSSGDVWTGDSSIQATVTLTWVPASGQTAATDPAPTSVMLIESSSASWTAQVYDSHAVYSAGTGKAADGIQDPEVDHSYQGATQAAFLPAQTMLLCQCRRCIGQATRFPGAC